MGCDIHIIYQKKTKDCWKEIKFKREYSDGPFSNRCYNVFAFLAGVRNYSNIKPISTFRDLPDDCPEDFKEECDDYGHTPSWLTIQELLDYDYNQEVEDLRVGKQITPNYYDSRWCCEPGQGKRQPLACYLGLHYFMDLLELHRAGVDRIIFCFDN